MKIQERNQIEEEIDKMKLTKKQKEHLKQVSRINLKRQVMILLVSANDALVHDNIDKVQEYLKEAIEILNGAELE